jgi:hypothetical protein
MVFSDEQLTEQGHGFSASVAVGDLRAAIHVGHRDLCPV